VHVADDDLTTALSDQVEGGPLLAAVYARVHSELGVTRMLGPLVNHLITRRVAKVKAHGIAEKTDIPIEGDMVLGLTAGELHIWSADSMLGEVKDHIGTVPREKLAGLEAGGGRVWRPAAVSLSDGQKIEVQVRGGVDEFVAAFG
jgi:hypothetical protein